MSTSIQDSASRSAAQNPLVGKDQLPVEVLARRHFGNTDMAGLLEKRRRESRDQPFVIWQPFDQPATTFTYGAVASLAYAAAAGLQRRGVRPGSRILVHLENSPEFVIAWLACIITGATAVTTNTRSALDELRYYADDAGVVGAITQPKFAEMVATAAPSLKWLVCTEHDSGVCADSARKPAHAESWNTLLGDPNDVQPRPPDLMLPFTVQYTSGTTSRPKGVVWTHANGLWAASINAAMETLRASDCHFTYLPLFHANATTFSLMPTLWAGGRMVLTPKWSTSRFWDLSQRHGCTWLSLIGLSFRAVATLVPPGGGHSYRLFGTGVCADEFPGLGVKTIGWWGMTETITPGIFGSAQAPNRLWSVGRAAPKYELAVLHDDGTPVQPEEPGHLFIRGVRGLSMFPGYLNNEKANESSFDADGWFKTGDMVVPHADGFYSFVDRSKDMLRVGAENVAASEVERVIAMVPGVIEAAIVGRPDEKLDEVPVAFVMANGATSDLEQRIRAQCRSMLADFKVPQDIYVVTQMPRSTISKINKAELRKVVARDADRVAAQRRWIDAAKSDPSGDQG